MEPRTLAIACVVGVCALCALPAPTRGNPTAPPSPTRIESVEEIRSDLADSLSGASWRQTRRLEYLWDGRRDLLIELSGGGSRGVRKAAIQALGRIGDPESRAALRAVIAGPDEKLEILKETAYALAVARDTLSIPLVQAAIDRIGNDSGADSKEARRRSLYKARLEDALACLRRPDLRRPLLLHDGQFIRYRFLLDDIEAITLIDDPLYGFPAELRRLKEHGRHRFDPSEHRTICDLLQDGKRVKWPGWLGQECLEIRLHDGRSVALNRKGSRFSLYGPGRFWVKQFCVDSPGLAAYLDDAIASAEERGGGDAPGGSSH
jgi:hypothetical protein